MPAYPLSPIGRNVPQAVPGVPVYLLGSYDYKVADTRMKVTNTALTSNVATVTVEVVEGNIPTTAQLVSIRNAANSVYNVTNVAISGVSIDATTGKGTITFALTHADIGSAASTGVAVAQQVQVGETLANGASLAVALQSNVGTNNRRDVRVDVTFPTAPTSVVVDLQGADVDIDSEYQNVTATHVVNGNSAASAIFTDIVSQFLRVNVSSLSGTGTIVAKLTI